MSPPSATISAHRIQRVILTGFDLDNAPWVQHLSGERYRRIADANFALSEPGEAHLLSDCEGTGAADAPWLPKAGDALFARIDPGSLRWCAQQPGLAHFLVDYRTGRDKAHPGCPRGHLRRVAARLESAGHHAWAASSWSFQLRLRGDRFSQRDAAAFLGELLETCNGDGIAVERLSPVGRSGHWRVDLAPTAALKAADGAALFRNALACAAEDADITISPAAQGSLLRLGITVGDAERNLLVPSKGKQPFSPEGKRLLEGIRAAQPALAKAFCPSSPDSELLSFRLQSATAAHRAHLVVRGPGEAQPHLATAAAFAAAAWGLESTDGTSPGLAELLGEPLETVLDARGAALALPSHLAPVATQATLSPQTAPSHA